MYVLHVYMYDGMYGAHHSTSVHVQHIKVLVDVMWYTVS